MPQISGFPLACALLKLCRGFAHPAVRERTPWSSHFALEKSSLPSLTLAPLTGVKEVDYRLYPSKEIQLQWLHSYLHAYKQLTQGDQGDMEVSEEELEALYVQVNKFSLVSGGDGKELASLKGCLWDRFFFAFG